MNFEAQSAGAKRLALAVEGAAGDLRMLDGDDQRDWKYFLRGGFAFQDAPFALHPKDEERARTMLSLARADKIRSEDIIAEAEDYLRDAPGWGSVSVEDQLKRVAKFIQRA